MNFKNLFRILKKVAPVVMMAAPSIIAAVKSAKAPKPKE